MVHLGGIKLFLNWVHYTGGSFPTFFLSYLALHFPSSLQFLQGLSPETHFGSSLASRSQGPFCGTLLGGLGGRIAGYFFFATL